MKLVRSLRNAFMQIVQVSTRLTHFRHSHIQQNLPPVVLSKIDDIDAPRHCIRTAAVTMILRTFFKNINSCLVSLGSSVRELTRIRTGQPDSIRGHISVSSPAASRPALRSTSQGVSRFYTLG